MIKKIFLDDVELSYYDSGGLNDVVVLLHGFPSSYSFWDEIVIELEKKDKRVLAIEQRGYPLSTLNNPDINHFNISNLSSDIESLVKKLSINEVSIIAHDWGTIVGWAIVQRNVINVINLISVCGGTEFPPSSVYKELNYQNGDHYITSFQNPYNASNYLDKDIDNFIKAAYRSTFSQIETVDLSMKSLFTTSKSPKLVVNDEIINKYTTHFKNSSLYQPICWYSNIDANIELSNSWRRTVTSKVTFLFGKNDLTVQLNDKMYTRLSNLGPNIQIQEINNAGHWLPLTHKESVLEHI
tara:strand:- start:68 stop:958 length:891 start_codon:yes stop_codon:yes gene_type:complete